jgi:hypothetical protein
MNLKWVDTLLTNMKDYHLPICILMFGVGSVLQWFHHLDMSYVAYTGTILGAITGHAFSPAQKDKPPSEPDAK